jgi:hypothetical protein
MFIWSIKKGLIMAPFLLTRIVDLVSSSMSASFARSFIAANNWIGIGMKIGARYVKVMGLKT